MYFMTFTYTSNEYEKVLFLLFLYVTLQQFFFPFLLVFQQSTASSRNYISAAIFFNSLSCKLLNNMKTALNWNSETFNTKKSSVKGKKISFYIFIYFFSLKFRQNIFFSFSIRETESKQNLFAVNADRFICANLYIFLFV